jgi:heme exporter protein D
MGQTTCLASFGPVILITALSHYTPHLWVAVVAVVVVVIVVVIAIVEDSR